MVVGREKREDLGGAERRAFMSEERRRPHMSKRLVFEKDWPR